MFHGRKNKKKTGWANDDKTFFLSVILSIFSNVHPINLLPVNLMKMSMFWHTQYICQLKLLQLWPSVFTPEFLSCIKGTLTACFCSSSCQPEDERWQWVKADTPETEVVEKKVERKKVSIEWENKWCCFHTCHGKWRT